MNCHDLYGETDVVTRPGIMLGLLGRGITESKSPKLHQAEARQQHMLLAYSLLDFDAMGWNDDKLPEILSAVSLAGFRGVNVTFPFKQAVLPSLDALSPEAAMIGAVNTIVFCDGKAVGHNTDATGFARGLQDQVSPERLDRVVQFGAGGAGAATAHAMLVIGVGHLTIVDPHVERVSLLVGALQRQFGADRVAGAGNASSLAPTASGIVNATPIGMAKLPGMPIDARLLEGRPWVYEIIYSPARTALIETAEAYGCQTIDGFTMVIHQAAAAFALFTGKTADVERMRRSLVQS